MRRTYNADKTKYIAESIGRHWEYRFEIWEKHGGFWGLAYWNTDKEEAWKHWERIKDEPIKKYDIGWIDFSDEGGTDQCCIQAVSA